MNIDWYWFSKIVLGNSSGKYNPFPSEGGVYIWEIGIIVFIVIISLGCCHANSKRELRLAAANPGYNTRQSLKANSLVTLQSEISLPSNPVYL